MVTVSKQENIYKYQTFFCGGKLTQIVEFLVEYFLLNWYYPLFRLIWLGKKPKSQYKVSLFIERQKGVHFEKKTSSKKILK